MTVDHLGRHAFIACGLAACVACVGDPVIADSGSPQDAMGTQEGGSDAGPVTDAPPDAPSTWCATNAPSALLCDDFDTGSFKSAWSKAGLLTVETSPHLSPSHAARAKTAGSAAVEVSLASFSSTQGSTSWQIEADMQILNNVMMVGASPIALRISFDGRDVVMNVRPWVENAVCATSAFLPDGAPFLITNAVPFPRGQWKHVLLGVENVNGSFTLKCMVAAASVGVAGLSGNPGAQRTFGVGVATTELTQPMDVAFDNVVITVK